MITASSKPRDPVQAPAPGDLFEFLGWPLTVTAVTEQDVTVSCGYDAGVPFFIGGPNQCLSRAQWSELSLMLTCVKQAAQ